MIVLVAAVVLAGCATTGAQSDGGANKDSLTQLRAELEKVKLELSDLRGDVQVLRGTVTRLQAALPNSGGVASTDSQTAPANEATKKMLDNVAQGSDVVRLWMGELNGVQFYVCPRTKGEDVALLKKELGDDYSYMCLIIKNTNKTQAYMYEPEIGLFRLQFEGDTPGAISFDPRQVINKIKMEKKSDSALESDFQAKNLLTNDTITTYILFPKGVDFTKVKALYMRTVLIREVKQ
jgi:hypothetical protein